jgi:hypothetical protein
VLTQRRAAFRIATTTCSLDEGARLFGELVAGQLDGTLKIALDPGL